MLKVGLCGYSMSAARYPAHFPVVEVQQTFYQPPATKVIERWRAKMPESFEFTVKVWMLVTHLAKSPTYRRLRRVLTDEERVGAGGFQESAIVDEAWRISLEAARILRATKLLFQCPASFVPTPENFDRMRRFFARIQRPVGMRLLFEPRGPAWTLDVVRPLVAELDLVHVVDPFVGPTVETELIYYRLHGIDGARHVYTDNELLKLAAMVPPQGDCYVMFNNITSAKDAERFKQLVGLPSLR